MSSSPGETLSLLLTPGCGSARDTYYLVTDTEGVELSCSALAGCSLEFLFDGKLFRAEGIHHSPQALEVIPAEILGFHLKNSRTAQVRVPFLTKAGRNGAASIRLEHVD